MLSFDNLQVSQEKFFDCARKHRITIFIALACSNENLVLGKVDILDPETNSTPSVEALRHSEASPSTRGASDDAQNPFSLLFR